MRRRLGITILIASLCALCMAFAACAPQVDKSNYTGEWELVSGSTDGLDADTIALARSLGSTATLSMNDDGTGALNLYGEISNLTWTAKSDTEGTVKVDNMGDATMKLENGGLSLIDGDNGSLNFKRP